eukprot:3051472-Pyramimonas_sp.AAC.1
MGPQLAENEAGAAACAPRFGPPAAPKKPRTRGHSYLRGVKTTTATAILFLPPSSPQKQSSGCGHFR